MLPSLDCFTKHRWPQSILSVAYECDNASDQRLNLICSSVTPNPLLKGHFFLKGGRLTEASSLLSNNLVLINGGC